MSFRVLFEDNHLLVVDKPSNLVTQPSLEHEDSLEKRAKEYIKVTYNKPGDVFLHAVHRLDKEVSGIVIFAKTSKALTRMNEIIRNKQLIKVYQAKVHGHLEKKEDKLVDFLLKEHHRASVSDENDPEAKEAILFYKVLSEEQDSSILEVILESGRYHQIRIQLSHLGHPIVGDAKYGSLIMHQDHHIDLKHSYIEFIHPVKNDLLKILSQY